jgi:hypothetical protein
MSYSIITENNDAITWSDPVQISGDPGTSSILGVTNLDGINIELLMELYCMMKMEIK